METGDLNRRFRGCWPSGALRSSAVMTRSEKSGPGESFVLSLSRPPKTLRRDSCCAECPGSYKHKMKRGGPRPPRFCRIGSAALVGNGCFRVRGEGGVADCAAQEVERLLERLVILFIGRHVRLRARFFAAFCLEVTAQRSLALGVGPRLQVFRHVLQHFDVGRDALGLNGAAGGCKVTRGGQPKCTIAGAKRNDGLHRALAERARAHKGRALVILQRTGNDL